ncbi:MAG: hypothetical protein QF684_04210 [Candidatus Thalassarchaeaceae archaeon]|jgi:hypothetical protein|nr:hypothetical protein [Candidatus Thalassarchaeaceae archaeon]
MKFHISGKIGVPVGIALLLLGVGITVSAFSIWEESEDFKAFMTEPSTEVSKEFFDDGDGGSAGWYIMIQGDYFADENDDNMTDACEGLNLTITDSSGNDVMDTAGTVYCTMDEKYHMIQDLDEEHVDANDEWIIVGIFCDLDDDAGMKGYWQSDEDGGDWVETDQSDRCRNGEYTISNQNSTTEMVLFDRSAQVALEWEGLLTFCGGLCCAICSLLMVIVSVISGFSMNPGTSAFTTMELGGASPVPVSGEGEGATVPGTTPGAIFGAGPPVQPSPVPLAEESNENSIESSADALKKQFLAGAAEQVSDSSDPDKE